MANARKNVHFWGDKETETEILKFVVGRSATETFLKNLHSKWKVLVLDAQLIKSGAGGST